MPLSRAQFDSLSAQGLTPEDIAGFEAKGVKPHSSDWRARMLSALPAVGATAGGILGGTAGAAAGGIGAIPGAAAGGALGAAGGRVLENVGRQAMGIGRNVGAVEGAVNASGGHLPPGVGPVLDTAEQAGLGALTEGGGTALFGVPGKAAGALESGMAGVASRQASKAEATAAKNAAEVATARNAAPEAQAALEEASAARNASSAKAREMIATAAGHPKAPLTTMGKLADRIMERHPKAYTDRNQLVDELHRQWYEVSKEVHGVPDRRTRFDLADLQHFKQTFDEFGSSARETQAAGGKRVSGLVAKAGDAARSLIEDAVPGVRAVNKETKRAIDAEKALRKFSRTQPTGAVAAIKSGQQSRTASVLARQNLEGPAFQPRLTMHGIDPGMPHMARLAGGTSRFFGHPAVANTGRYAGDASNLLLRLIQEQQDPNYVPDQGGQ